MHRKLVRFSLLTFLLLALVSTTYATHNRAGEIIVELLPDEEGNCAGSLTVKATIITYTRTSSIDADRDSLTLCWGDGTCERVVRMNGGGNPPQGEPLENDIKFNFYMSTHTYDGFGQYTVSMEDPNRNAGILNVNFPNSVSVPFYLETVYTLVNPQFQGCNNSPVLQVPPIDFACMGEVFTHNPGADDQDGDSLSYELTVPLQGPDDPVPAYEFPPNITIDPVTGDLVWDTPTEVGAWNIAIWIISYRNGEPFDTLIRDMQIIVEDCINDPPVVFTEVEELCVVAGELIDFEVIATAPITDVDQEVRLLAYGAPFNFEDSPAEFLPDSDAYEPDPLIKNFRWQTTCDHISGQPYNVVFRAVDNFLGDTTGLATLKTIRIKVVGPPPEDVQASALGEQVTVSWELPYVCEDASDDYFRGFTVWRRINSDQTPVDTCVTGLAGRGYTKLTDFPVLDMDGGRYIYVDNNVERGRTYCYRILAEFARRTASEQFFYNRVESLPSEEVCVQLGRDVPLLTNVDVLTTDQASGSIEVCWSKPVEGDLDTINNPGPYVYELLRAVGHTEAPSAFTVIATFTSESFAMANDTCFTDTGLNTVDQPYSYFLNFYVDSPSRLLGASNVAGSIYLQTTPTDRTNILTWDEFVPWENYSYVIFRENTGGTFDSIATVIDPIYRDTGLNNGQEYCYFVRAEGTYNVVGIKDPLFNRSQQRCDTPIDNVPPCPPELAVSNLCDDGAVACEQGEELFNTLEWVSPVDLCDLGEDTDGFRIYYAPFQDAEFELVATIDDEGLTTFEHQPPVGIAGCYALTAVDTAFNESAFSNIVCVDNCPFFELPNAFTPNNDGQNDLFVPRIFCFIERVEFQVFNRWGGLVFETSEPALNWDGTNLKGEELAEGTYFYRCRVFERRVEGIIPSAELFSGYIELIRGAP